MGFPARRFTLVMLAMSAVSVFGAALMNCFIDPFDRLGRNRLGVYVMAEREVKASEVTRFPHNALFVGNSRMQAIQASQLSFHQFWTTVTDSTVVAAYKLTFGASLMAALVNGVFGLLIAWVLTRYRFYGRRILDAMMHHHRRTRRAQTNQQRLAQTRERLDGGGQLDGILALDPHLDRPVVRRPR